MLKNQERCLLKIKRPLAKNAGIRADNKAYEKKVQASVKGGKERGISHPSTEKCKVKAKMDAERRFNPSPQQQASGGMSAEAEH